MIDTVMTVGNVAACAADGVIDNGVVMAECAGEAMAGISGLDTVWVLLAAMLVFWMQPGFALVEAGMTRAKNTANILILNHISRI